MICGFRKYLWMRYLKFYILFRIDGLNGFWHYISTCFYVRNDAKIVETNIRQRKDTHTKQFNRIIIFKVAIALKRIKIKLKKKKKKRSFQRVTVKHFGAITYVRKDI